jgi:D-arabinose 1-dehydrogenase-like Zn-dependent alcohol dehydrogenase
MENLCDKFRATGCDADGGYAEYTTVHEDFAYPVPGRFTDVEAAPLMCAGAIGYRALRLTGMQNGWSLGLYGFGASAHLVLQMVNYQYPDSRVFVFTRNRDDAPGRLAKTMGADWVGVTGEQSPEKLACAIDTTPTGIPVREAMLNLDKGGRLVINAIRKETPVPEHGLHRPPVVGERNQERRQHYPAGRRGIPAPGCPDTDHTGDSGIQTGGSQPGPAEAQTGQVPRGRGPAGIGLTGFRPEHCIQSAQGRYSACR